MTGSTKDYNGIRRPIRAATYRPYPVGPPSLPVPPGTISLRPTRPTSSTPYHKTELLEAPISQVPFDLCPPPAGPTPRLSPRTSFDTHTVSSKNKQVDTPAHFKAASNRQPLVTRGVNTASAPGDGSFRSSSRASARPSLNVCAEDAETASFDTTAASITASDSSTFAATNEQHEAALIAPLRERKALSARLDSALAQRKAHELAGVAVEGRARSLAACPDAAAGERTNYRRVEAIRCLQLAAAEQALVAVCNDARKGEERCAALKAKIGEADKRAVRLKQDAQNATCATRQFGTAIEAAQAAADTAAKQAANDQRANSELRARIAGLEAEKEALAQVGRNVEGRLADSERALAIATGQAHALAAATAEMRGEIVHLTDRCAALDKDNTELRARAVARRIAGAAEPEPQPGHTYDAAMLAVRAAGQKGRRAGALALGLVARHRMAAAVREARARGGKGWLGRLGWW
ncbi:hypothetical protein Q5752_002852 [Cryptotrichosporon argae]